MTAVTYTTTDMMQTIDAADSATAAFIKPAADQRIRETERINKQNAQIAKQNDLRIKTEEVRAEWIAFCAYEETRYFTLSMEAYEKGDDKGSEKMGNRSLDFSTIKHWIAELSVAEFINWHNRICDDYERSIKQNTALPSAVAKFAGFFSRNFGKRQTA